MTTADDDAPDRQRDPLLGQVFAGSYRLDARLGTGSTGVVYRAHHLLLGRDVAVKVLREELAEDARVRARLLAEAEALSTLAHPGIVALRHVGDAMGRLYLVTDLCPGETLAQRLRARGPLSPDEATSIALGMLEPLAVAHQAGIVHRDLKPANVMVLGPAEGPHEVRILDFGLSRSTITRDAAPPGALATCDGDLVGTVAYMSPEQIRAGGAVDQRTDLYAMGVVLYEMVTGRLPFDGHSALSVMLRIVDDPPAPVDPALPTSLRELLDRALEKDPARRLASAGAFAAALRGAPLAPPPRLPLPSRLRGRSRRRLVAVGAVALAAVGTLALARRGAKEDDPVADAARLFATCRPTDAATRLTEAAAAPDAPAPLVVAAALATVRDERMDADRWIDRAERAIGRTPSLLLARGRYLWRVRGDFPGGLAAVEDAYFKDGSLTEALVERAHLLLALVERGGVLASGQEPLRRLEADLDLLDAVRPEDPDALFVRARSLLLAAALGPKTDASRILTDSIATAERAAAADPAWGAPKRTAGEGALLLSARAAADGDHATARSHAEVARQHLDEAVARGRAQGTHRCQAKEVPAWLHARAAVRAGLGDHEGALADATAALGTDDDPTRSLVLAVYLRNAGRFAEAVPIYEHLVERTQDPSAWFDLPFCFSRLGLEFASSGDRAAARAAHARARTRWRQALRLRPDDAVMLAYFAEGLLHAADAEDEDRLSAPLLQEAADAFEHARRRSDALPPEQRGPRQEVEFRRALWLARAGRIDEAITDLGDAIGGATDLNPSFYARMAWLHEVRAGLAAARTDDDLHADRWLSRIPADGAEPQAALRPWHTRRAFLRADSDHAGPDLRLEARRSLVAATADAAPRPEARTSRWLLAELDLRADDLAPTAASALAEALVARRETTRRALWPPDASWLEPLARALDAAGRTEDAAAARHEAARRGRYALPR